MYVFHVVLLLCMYLIKFILLLIKQFYLMEQGLIAIIFLVSPILVNVYVICIINNDL